LDWLVLVPEDYDLYISNSGETAPELPELPNPTEILCIENDLTKRESAHWLRFIVDHYEALPEVSIFLQGCPHSEPHGEVLLTLGREYLTREFGYLGGPAMRPEPRRAEHDPEGQVRFWTRVGKKLGPPVSKTSGTCWGGQHYVTREAILRYPLEWYRALLEKPYEGLGFFPTLGHFLEHRYNMVYGCGPQEEQK
jgi:hypothetical protein